MKRLLTFMLLNFLVMGVMAEEVPVKKIAFIGRYDDLEGNSGSNEWYDTFVANSLQAYLRTLNERGYPVRYSLEVFNIHHDPSRADSVYRLVARDNDFVLVLDNSWGHDMVGGRQTIIENNIPVISINAYKGDNDYGPQSLFLLDYEKDIYYISAFAKEILEVDSVDFISEDDVVFHQHFLDSFEEFDLTPVSITTYTGQQNINDKDSAELFSRLYKHFVEDGNTDNRVVLYNAHFMWGNALVEFLNDHLTNSKFMSWSVPQNEYIDALKNGNEVIMHHKSRYAVSEPVYLEYRKLLANQPEYFTWDGAASIMEDLRNAIDILGNYTEQFDKPEQINKQSLADYFIKISGQATIGDNDIFRFNDKGALIREKTFTVYSQGGNISYYPFQLNDTFEVVPSLNLGIDLQTIYDIDLNTNSFKADFEFWLTGDSMQFSADQFIRIKNLHRDESVVDLLTERYENGKFLKRYSVSGKFYTTYKAASYPFDVQELNVEIELLNPTDELRITIDPVTFEERIDDIKINGWKSYDYYVTVRNNIFKDFLTDRKMFNKNEIINIHFYTQRNIWGSVLQIILPLFFIGTISIGILYVRSLSFSDLGEVIVGLFLSIVAFSISLAQLTPKFDDLQKPIYYSCSHFW